MKHSLERVTNGVDRAKGELRLTWLEWRDLLSQSAAYEFEKRIERSMLYEPLTASLETISENVKKISSRGNKARLKLGRILVRLTASVVNQNTAAFEAAVRDLIELGKSVQNG